MEEIVRPFFEKRTEYRKQHVQKTESMRLQYVKKRDDIRRQIAIVISLLYNVKFDLERNGNANKELEQMWTHIDERITYVCSLVKSSCYIVYRSPKRGNVSMNLVKLLSKTAISAMITIGDCKTKFYVNGNVMYATIKRNNLELNIDENTTIQFSKNLIQLPGDSISIEYVDVFSNRFNRAYKYKGFDNGHILKWKKILNRTLSIENVQRAIDMGMELIQI